MFSKAYKIATGFTQPVVASVALMSGQSQSSIGSYVLLNDEGWIMTAAHMIEILIAAQQHEPLVANYNKQVAAINAAAGMMDIEKSRAIANVPVNQGWITKFSYWWGIDGLTIDTFSVDRVKDIAVGKFTTPPPPRTNYPIFRNSAKQLTPGTSLCRLGFPFSEIATKLDPATGNFQLDTSSFPIPYFPLDGIMTRNVNVIDPTNNERAHFIETSTPGLRGQSGGPIFDVDGHVCGLQSRTQHFPLGFDINVKDLAGKEVTDRQYLHTGLGLHSDEIMAFLDAKAIAYQVAP